MPTPAIMRPSIVFGPEDDFFNRFAALARMSPVLPLIGGGAHALPAGVRRRRRRGDRRGGRGKARAGTTYELGGPEVLRFKELMQFVLATIERSRLLVPLPFSLAKLQASVSCNSCRRRCSRPTKSSCCATDNVVSDAAKRDGRTLAGLRHRAGADGSDRAVLSVALPQDRPVPQPRSLNVIECRSSPISKTCAQLARRKVPQAIFDYVDRGSYDEISLPRQPRRPEAIRFRQRVLIDADNR